MRRAEYSFPLRGKDRMGVKNIGGTSKKKPKPNSRNFLDRPGNARSGDCSIMSDYATLIRPTLGSSAHQIHTGRKSPPQWRCRSSNLVEPLRLFHPTIMAFATHFSGWVSDSLTQQNQDQAAASCSSVAGLLDCSSHSCIISSAWSQIPQTRQAGVSRADRGRWLSRVREIAAL